MENSIQKWIEQPFSKLAVGAIVVLAVLAGISIPSFIQAKFNQDAVSIGGKKYDITDVKKTSPIAYSKYQTDYAALIKNTLAEFAQDKLFEIVGAEKNIPAADVLKQGFVPKEPTDQEIADIYNTYKAQLGGKSLAQSKDQIVGLLKNQQEQEHSRNVYKEIVQKYPVDFLIKEPDVVRVTVDTENNPSIGAEKAKITVIEFSDFECPYCKRSQDVSRRLREKYKDQIRWVFRDFPLPFHQDAMYAHMAANCSISQGKYWEVFPILFENSGNLSASNVDFLVTKAGVDKTKYQACMNDKDKLQAEINKDIQDGQKVGVSGTPAFFINGIFVSGALPYENFEEIIEKELKN
ncbi:DsbA family protein [Leptospira sp. 'Mane']|uniref:DsbA family protein n=1 Tax=Leptospira sp. 'Mane' TaxID=3387407 RepID=UPI00398A9EA8